MEGQSPTTETRTIALDLPEGGFRLRQGGLLRRIDVSYETCGTLSGRRDNVVFVCHALTGDAHVAGRHEGEDRDSGWWANMVRPGGGIDTDKFFVVCANVLGGCMGTTGPSSVDPETGAPYGSSFPEITVSDIVDVHVMLLRQLGFDHVYAVIGGSFGGMQALEFAVRHPDFADKIAVIASGASLTTQALAFDVVGRNAIEQDPDFRGGDYYGRGRPDAGLSQARELAHITYLSGDVMKKKFGRRRRDLPPAVPEDGKHPGPIQSVFEVESYLRHQGRKFLGRFDANSYLRITAAMDEFDLAQGFHSLSDALEPVRAKILAVALDGDWLFLPRQTGDLAKALLEAHKDVSSLTLDAPAGHDSFLIHIEELQRVVRGFLERVPVRPEPAIDSDHRRDWDALESLLPPRVRTVLDIACGSGDLLNFLAEKRPWTDCTGIDLDVDGAVATLAAGHNLMLADVDDGLAAVPSDSFDCAILSESLQVMRRPDKVLTHLLRIAPMALVSFPNFGMWKIPVELAFRGRMPVTKRLPYQWYDTPNIHLCTVKDFLDLCENKGVKVEKVVYFSTLRASKILRALGARSLGTSRVLVKIVRARQ
ncbi:MAG: homoserine O-acetyltransferase [Kiritimatiellae bacterium]|nr:homoserine O-acetyltransferase [Kiritimatiellia bacterium]